MKFKWLSLSDKDFSLFDHLIYLQVVDVDKSVCIFSLCNAILLVEDLGWWLLDWISIVHVVLWMSSSSVLLDLRTLIEKSSLLKGQIPVSPVAIVWMISPLVSSLALIFSTFRYLGFCIFQNQKHFGYRSKKYCI